MPSLITDAMPTQCFRRRQPSFGKPSVISRLRSKTSLLHDLELHSLISLPNSHSLFLESYFQLYLYRIFISLCLRSMYFSHRSLSDCAAHVECFVDYASSYGDTEKSGEHIEIKSRKSDAEFRPHVSLFLIFLKKREVFLEGGKTERMDVHLGSTFNVCSALHHHCHHPFSYPNAYHKNFVERWRHVLAVAVSCHLIEDHEITIALRRATLKRPEVDI